MGVVVDVESFTINGVHWLIRKDNLEHWVVKDGIFEKDFNSLDSAKAYILDCIK